MRSVTEPFGGLLPGELFGGPRSVCYAQQGSCYSEYNNKWSSEAPSVNLYLHSHTNTKNHIRAPLPSLLGGWQDCDDRAGPSLLVSCSEHRFWVSFLSFSRLLYTGAFHIPQWSLIYSSLELDLLFTGASRTLHFPSLDRSKPYSTLEQALHWSKPSTSHPWTASTLRYSCSNLHSLLLPLYPVLLYTSLLEQPI